jgi:DNA processing protein
MNKDRVRYWLALKQLPDVGNVTCKNLITTFGSPREVFQASIGELTKVPHVTDKIARRIITFNDWSKIDDELERAEKLTVSIITADDPLYPQNLLTI